MSSLLQLQYPQYVVLCQPVPYVNFRLQEIENLRSTSERPIKRNSIAPIVIQLLTTRKVSNKPSVVASKVKKAQSAKKGVQKDADKKKVVKMTPANIEDDGDIVMLDAKINDKPKMSAISDMKLENPALLESLREEIVTSLSATGNLPTDKQPLKECPFCSTFATRDLLNEHKQSNHTEKNGRKQTTESAPS